MLSQSHLLNQIFILSASFIARLLLHTLMDASVPHEGSHNPTPINVIAGGDNTQHTAPSTTLRGNLILDTSFLIHLEALEIRCRDALSNKRQGEMPLAGLNHFLKHGCNLIIPHEVLKEVFTNRETRVRFGLSAREDDTPFLNKDLLRKQAAHPIIKAFLLANIEKIHCFPSVEAYQQSDDAKHSNRIAIICGEGEDKAEGNGIYQAKAKQTKGTFGHGDDQIVSILRALPANAPNHTPNVVLTTDKLLKERCYATRHCFRVLFPSSYCDALYLSGFVNDLSLFNRQLRICFPGANIPQSLKQDNARDVTTRLGLNTRERPFP